MSVNLIIEDGPNAAALRAGLFGVAGMVDAFSDTYVLRVCDVDGNLVAVNGDPILNEAGTGPRLIKPAELTAGGYYSTTEVSTNAYDLVGWHDATAEFSMDGLSRLSFNLVDDAYDLEPWECVVLYGSSEAAPSIWYIETITETYRIRKDRRFVCANMVGILDRYPTLALTTAETSGDIIAIREDGPAPATSYADDVFRFAVSQAPPDIPAAYRIKPGTIDSFRTKPVIDWVDVSPAQAIADLREQCGGAIVTRTNDEANTVISWIRQQSTGVTFALDTNTTEVSKTTDYRIVAGEIAILGGGTWTPEQSTSTLSIDTESSVPGLQVTTRDQRFVNTDRLADRLELLAETGLGQPVETWAIGAIDLGTEAMGGGLYPGGTVTISTPLGTTTQVIATLKRDLDRPFKITITLDSPA